MHGKAAKMLFTHAGFGSIRCCDMKKAVELVHMQIGANTDCEVQVCS